MRGSLQVIERNLPLHSQRLLEIRLSDVCWFLAINGLLFESYLTTIVSFASFFDEIVTVLLLISAAFSTSDVTGKDVRRLSTTERLSIIVLLMLIGIGLLGSLVSAIQPNLRPVLIDAFTCVKFPVALLSSCVVFSGRMNLFDILATEAKILLISMFPFAILNQFVDMGMRFDFRYGLHSFEFIFGHPSSLAAVMASLSVLFFARRQGSGKWLALCWLYLVLSLRSTAIAFAALSCLAWFTSKKRGHISVWQTMAFTLIALCFGWGQIQYYFFETDGSARRELLDVGLQIANRFFPLGSGFATYASNITSEVEYYSPLYYEYGISGIYGLSIEDPSFISDSFWPIIIGEFGWFGTLLFILLLLLLYVGCLSRLRKKAMHTLPVSVGFAYLCIASVGSSAFFHPMAVFFAICISLALSCSICTE